MPSVGSRFAVISLLSAAVLACESTSPNPVDLTDVLLDFCASDMPLFFAVQNEGEGWTRVIPDAQGTAAFQATATFGMAIVRQRSGRTITEYIHATPADIEALNGVNCIDQTGTKSLNGTVASVSAGTGAVVTLANSWVELVAPTSAFTLTDLPNGRYDLIAHREIRGVSSVQPDRVIVRRSQDRANGSTIPVLDFGSTEAVPAVSHTVTAAGLSGNDINEYLLTFSTPTTRRHSLSLVEEFVSSTRTIYGVPGTLTQAGDFHELEVFADAGTAYRGEVHFYRTPGNRTANLGAHLNNPTLTFLPATSQLRPRTQLPSQLEYGAFATMVLEQDTRTVIVTATNSFFGGTPAIWDLQVPDLSTVPGFPTAARLQPGLSTNWDVEAYGGPPAAFLGAPADGAVLHFAGRSFNSAGAAASLRAERAGRGSALGRRGRLGRQ